MVDHETGLRAEVGYEAGEPVVEDATSYSVRRQASEQYTLPSVCLSQARQKSGDQSISVVIVYWWCSVEGLRVGDDLTFGDWLISTTDEVIL